MSNMNDPARCATGCGFYGNPTQNNLCSKCYKDSLKQTALQQQQEQLRTTTTTTTTICSNTTTNNNKVETKVTNEDPTMKKTMKKRCGCCNKRVGLTGFECRCGEVYCGSHRYPELHSCPFNFKAVEVEALSKTLYSAAECKADKLHYRL